ncbi:hypothetical protein [Cellulomonas xiejunii]|uniref:Uncharacterized protein n=1 Tax=Cellulomonas xiejunii TaxID=2968083 RepID=A0ABY5KK48_9CELL|nr:hypothetical protein [Cellulomonas xiejunii]MCC2315425.1 hypothetical protein [Cellulomonas xiejunii]MCC2320588.1 hypothetical protein [Cellulomonas xiejunii]UUI70879.1 hypothetical protein NP048_13915 [Cellulomonas xiejunii]
MFTFLRRAVATLLVAGGLLLASTGALLGADDYTMPGALMLVLTGGAALLIGRRSRPQPAAPVRPPVRPGAWVAPSAVTLRAARHCAVPAPRGAPDLDAPVGGMVGTPPATWRPARASGARYGVRHCVLPRGAVPHQRRASDGS